MQNTFNGFSPMFDSRSSILILGSFPSVKSRETNFYYGNPQNRFWSILSEFFCQKVYTVEQKSMLLLQHRIALWNIVSQCEIVGSLDANISNYVVNDLAQIFKKANIVKIFLNGKTSQKIFQSNYPSLIPLSVGLPSTSPANTRFDKKIWLDELQKNKAYLF